MKPVIPRSRQAASRLVSWDWGCIFVAAGALVLAVGVRSPPAPGPSSAVSSALPWKSPRRVKNRSRRAQAPTRHKRWFAVPAGSYQPFYKQGTGSKTRRVDAFLLDARPVTRGDYLVFVTLRPAWRKSAVEPLFAENAYLSDWRGDLDPGESSGERPATFVSWFAAKAYCECRGKRLPTVIEWEWAAGGEAGASEAKAGRSPFQFAMGKNPEHRAELGFAGVWEWTSDFNSVLISGRSDTGSGSSLFCGDGYRANDAKDYAGFLRHSFRASLKASYTLKNLGFRCAKDSR